MGEVGECRDLRATDIVRLLLTNFFLGVIKLPSPRIVLVIARSDPLTNSDLITLENLPGVKVATPLVMFSISAREGCRIG